MTYNYQAYVYFSTPQIITSDGRSVYGEPNVIVMGDREVHGALVPVTSPLSIGNAKEILQALQNAAYAAGGVFVRPDCFVTNATYVNLIKV